MKIRVPNYLSINFMEYGTYSIPFYPLLDEDVLSYSRFLAENGQMFDLVSERLFFAATKLLCAEMTVVPLAGKRFRFEAHGKSPDAFLAQGYDERDPATVGLLPIARNEGVAPDVASEISKCRAYINGYMRKSKTFDRIRPMIDPKYLDGNGLGFAGRSQREAELLHAVFGLCRLWDH